MNFIGLLLGYLNSSWLAAFYGQCWRLPLDVFGPTLWTSYDVSPFYWQCRAQWKPRTGRMWRINIQIQKEKKNPRHARDFHNVSFGFSSLDFYFIFFSFSSFLSVIFVARRKRAKFLWCDGHVTQFRLHAEFLSRFRFHL